MLGSIEFDESSESMIESIEGDQRKGSIHVGNGQSHEVSLFYRYLKIKESDIDKVVEGIQENCINYRLFGRCLVCVEGVNGTFAGPSDLLHTFESVFMGIYSGFEKIDFKYSSVGVGHGLPFKELSVRRVDSLISCGTRIGSIIDDQIVFDESYGGLAGTGVHLSPREFHEEVLQIKRGAQQGLILDVRNVFESEIGQFEGAKGLDTYYYSESWDAIDRRVQEFVAEKEQQHPKVLMYCTGGIRCEKASAYLKAKGFKDVYQLQGGIHRYLDEFGAAPDRLFKGKNYVFDQRMSLVSNAVEDGVAEGVVVGRCIDCDCPHDAYEADKVCTVCRYPLLVCPSCVEGSATREFHCHRHRDLKECYFSDLYKFTVEQLQSQASELRAMEMRLMGNQAKKSKRRTLRLQVIRIEARLKELLDTSAS